LKYVCSWLIIVQIFITYFAECTWEDNSKMDLRKAGWVRGGGIDWIELAQDRDRWWAFVNAVMNLRVS
jgi:hypothetical protein